MMLETALEQTIHEVREYAAVRISERERRIAFLLSRGYGYKQIARDLGVTTFVVTNSVRELRQKTNSATTVEAVVVLVRAGVV